MKQKPMIDELLEEYLPERYYGRKVRKHAKELALQFNKDAIQELATTDVINTGIFLGRELTEDENNRITKRWGYGTQQGNKITCDHLWKFGYDECRKCGVNIKDINQL